MTEQLELDIKGANRQCCGLGCKDCVDPTAEVDYTIYSTPTCNYCKEAKKLALRAGMRVHYFDVTTNEDAKEFFQVSGFRTVPQILASDGRLVGGYEHLRQELLS